MEYYSSLDSSQLNADVPTLFEIISSNQLESLLSPSLRYVLVHYANRFPHLLLKVVNNFDELNLFLRTFVEWYFIKYWQGSFTENFYGLKRVSHTPLAEEKYQTKKVSELIPSLIEERRKLSSIQVLASVFEITGTAYLTEKFNYWYDIWYPMYITKQLETNKDDVWKKKVKLKAKIFFVKYYPLVLGAFRAGNLISTLLFLGGKSYSPSLITLLFRINYARLNQYDYSSHDHKIKDKRNHKNRVSPPSNLSIVIRILKRYFAMPLWKVIKLLLGTFFPAAIFTLKFLEWYNNTNFAQKIAQTQGNTLKSILPTPSSILKYDSRKKKKGYQSSEDCPLCKEKISNPAVIETGYVFCYSCIYDYLSKSHKIVAATRNLKTNDDENKTDENIASEQEQSHIDLELGGRCPITGKKLLGCRWNTLKGEWEIEGIRRLIL